MAIPSETTGWNSGGANRVEPSSGKKVTGWIVDETPPSSYFNWLFANIEAWLVYLSTFLSTANVWTALQQFNNGIQAIATTVAPGILVTVGSLGFQPGMTITNGGTANALNVTSSNAGTAAGGISVASQGGIGIDVSSTGNTGLRTAGNLTYEALCLLPQAQPSTPHQGAIIFNSVAVKHQAWDGSAWHNLY